jgi:hypothetical protein
MTPSPTSATPSDANVPLRPSHERAARKLLAHFADVPADVQRHFLALQRDDIGSDSWAEAEGLRARVEELQADKRRLEIKIVGLESEVEEAKAERKSKLAPDGTTSHGMIWKGDDERGYLAKVGDRYYVVRRYITASTGRGKNKTPGHFVYDGHCLDIGRLEENPALISRIVEAIPWPTIRTEFGEKALPCRTADEAKALCADFERKKNQPAATKAKTDGDTAPPDDGIPACLRRSAS